MSIHSVWLLFTVFYGSYQGRQYVVEFPRKSSCDIAARRINEGGSSLYSTTKSFCVELK